MSDIKSTIVGVLVGFVILIIVFGLLAYLRILPLSGIIPVLQKQQPTGQSLENQSQTIKSSPLFSSQTATIIGSVKRVEGNKLTVRDQRLQEDTFDISSDFAVYEYKEAGAEPQITKGTSGIKIGQEGTIFLSAIGGGFKIVSISYVSIPPPSPTR